MHKSPKENKWFGVPNFYTHMSAYEAEQPKIDCAPKVQVDYSLNLHLIKTNTGLVKQCLHVLVVIIAISSEFELKLFKISKFTNT